MALRVVGYKFGQKGHGRVGTHDKMETWYEFNVRSDGSIGKGLIENCAWYTPLFTCHVCRKLSTPKNVRWRYDTYFHSFGKGGYKRGVALNGVYIEEEHVLCTGCWNRKRSFVKKLREADEIRILINKLQKEISNERKNQDDRSDARLSCYDDGGS